MKKLLILAVLALVVGQVLLGFIPGLPSLRDLDQPAGTPPVEAPLAAIAWEDVSFKITQRSEGTFVNTNGDYGSTYIANPIGSYVPHNNPWLTGSITGGSGPMVTFQIDGSARITRGTAGELVQSVTFPTQQLPGHLDGAGDLTLSLPPSFYKDRANYVITGSLYVIALDSSGKQVSGVGVITSLTGEVNVQ